MTRKRMHDAWMPAGEYGRSLPQFSVNLLVREVERSLPFYKEVLGAELCVMGVDPDAAERRAKTAGAKILQPAMDFPHGSRDIMLEDPDGNVWAVGISIP